MFDEMELIEREAREWEATRNHWLKHTKESISHNCIHSNDPLGVTQVIMLGQHRDSDALDRSNWEVITTDLEERFGEEDPVPAYDTKTWALGEWEVTSGWHIERFGHWAVGWVEYLVVDVNTPAFEAMVEWREKLDGYPVADDDHFSELEWSELHEHAEWMVRFWRKYGKLTKKAERKSDGDLAHLMLRQMDDCINTDTFDEDEAFAELQDMGFAYKRETA